MNFKEMMINVYINNLGNVRREQSFLPSGKSMADRTDSLLSKMSILRGCLWGFVFFSFFSFFNEASAVLLKTN